MNFEAIRYMEWVKTLPPPEVDLRLSGVNPYPIRRLNFPWEEAELTSHNVYGYPPLNEK